MPAAAPYQGHESKNAWAVFMWLTNTATVYAVARDAVRSTFAAADNGAELETLLDEATEQVVEAVDGLKKHRDTKPNFATVRPWVENFVIGTGLKPGAETKPG